MEYPSRLIDDDEVKLLEQEPDVQFVIPFYIRSQGNKWTFALILHESNKIRFKYYNPAPSHWQEYNSIQVDSSSIDTVVESLYVRDLKVFGESSKECNISYEEFGEKLEGLYREPVIPYDHRSAKHLYDRITPQECDCELDSNNLIPSKFEIENGPDIPMTICRSCGRGHHLLLNEKQIPIGSFLDQPSIVERLNVVSELEGENTNILRVQPSGNGITHLVVGALISNSNDETSPATNYDVKKHNMLLSINEQTISGIAVWGDSELDHPILHQLYVRPEFRRSGIGSDLFNTWVSEIVSDDVAYLDNPNPKSRSLHHKVGAYSRDDVELIELVRFSPVGIEMNTGIWEVLGNSAIPN